MPARLSDKVRSEACVGWPFNSQPLGGVIIKMKDKVPPELQSIAQAAGSDSRGIIVLFAGNHGTGKTMAAEILANYLNLDLFRIDLSRVVNKYIGETEKNLQKVFDAAQNSGAILFFDEADALFGKRTEVKDSHDRYANVETEYLLQQLEHFHGIVIFATNRRDDIDEAFLKKIPYILVFPSCKTE